MTHEEKMKIYLEMQHEGDINDTKTILREMNMENLPAEFIEKLANEYRKAQDEYTMDHGFYRDCMMKVIAENPIKKKYNVRISMIYTTDIEVEAANEKEAEQLALKLEKDADYNPIIGTMEVDDVFVL